MKTKLIATGGMTYATRRLKAGDEFEATPRYARVLTAIGKARLASQVRPRAVPEHNEKTMLRAEYERVHGKKPFGGWDETTLRDKIAAALKEG